MSAEPSVKLQSGDDMLGVWTAPRVGHQAKRQAQAVSSSLAEPELRFSGGRRWAGDNVAAMA